MCITRAKSYHIQIKCRDNAFDKSAVHIEIADFGNNLGQIDGTYTTFRQRLHNDV